MFSPNLIIGERHERSFFYGFGRSDRRCTRKLSLVFACTSYWGYYLQGSRSARYLAAWITTCTVRVRPMRHLRARSSDFTEMDSTKQKMLKKARSFRDRIRRGTITRGLSRAESPIKALPPPTGPLSPTLPPAELAGSDARDQQAVTAAASDSAPAAAAAVAPAAEKLSSEYKKVHQAIKFMLYAVDKVNLVMLPGSATITLETVLELIGTVTTVLASHDESNLMSAHLKRVYNALADLIQWSDTVMLTPATATAATTAAAAATTNTAATVPPPTPGPPGGPAATGGHKQKRIDADSARLVISSLHDSVKELADLATAKAAQYTLTQQSDSCSSPASSYNMATLPKGTLKKSSSMNMTDKVKRNSLPEIPLTPREKTILKETSYGAFDNPLLGHGEPVTPSRVEESQPPPKPYLPPDFDLRVALPSLAFTGPPPTADGAAPPPLPYKRRDRLCSSEDAAGDAAVAAEGAMADRHGSSGGLSQLGALRGALPPPGPPTGPAAAPAAPVSPGSTRSSMSSGDDLLNGSANGSRRSYNRYSSGDELDDMRQPYVSAAAVNDHYRYHEVTLRHARAAWAPLDGVSDETRHRANSDYDNVEGDEEDDGGSGRLTAVCRDPGAAQLSAGIFVYPDVLASAAAGVGGFARRGVADWSHSSAGSAAAATAMSAQRALAKAWSQQRHDQLSGGGGFVKSVSASDAFVSAASFGYHVSMGGSTAAMATAVDAAAGAGRQDLALHPPPLPPKRRHVESYMNVFGPYSMSQLDYSPPSAASLLHSRRFYQHVQERHQWELFHSARSSTVLQGGIMPSPSSTVQQLPAPVPVYVDSLPAAGAAAAPSQEGRGLPLLPVKQSQRSGAADLDPPKSATVGPSGPAAPVAIGTVAASSATAAPSASGGHLTAGNVRRSSLSPAASPAPNSRAELPEADATETNPLDSLDVSPFLIREKQSSNGRQSVPELKGGPVDALVVYATYCPKQDFMYQEAFLTTYRTFISPSELIDKLLFRYHKFALVADDNRRRASRSAFGLLVRVVDELSTAELTESISQLLLQLVCDLVREGELTLARILRKKVLEKVDPTQKPVDDLVYHIVQLKPAKPPTLLDFSAQGIAEQMTLMDKEFYERLDIAELLIWSKSQDEERCVNLVQFTAHFNKMSWWCRTLILLADDPALREKYFLKFVKVLKHLRKLNNFNSFLALLSALDSAPVRRLDWPKQATEVIKDFSVLIDSSSSFKAYRTALAETDPPCIPYIGIILQDMTFIRLGSMPLLPDGKINFVMRWQLFNVLECLRRFRKPDYGCKKDPKVVQFLNNFDECVTSDDDLWERSKQLKPTATK